MRLASNPPDAKLASMPRATVVEEPPGNIMVNLYTHKQCKEIRRRQKSQIHGPTSWGPISPFRAGAQRSEKHVPQLSHADILLGLPTRLCALRTSQ